MSAGDMLAWMTVGAMCGWIVFLIAKTWPRSSGSAGLSLGFPTSYTSVSGSTLYGSTKNGVLRFDAGVLNDSGGALTKVWDNEEDETAYG